MLLTVFDISSAACRRLVLRYHYSGRIPGISRAWGLLYGNKIVGCVVYSIPASYTLCRGVCGPEYARQVLELSRLVVITKQRNAASYLIGESLRRLGREMDRIVVSYADCNSHVSHIGYVYQATNWIYTGHASTEPIWVDPRDGTIVSYTRRHIDVKARKLGIDWTELERRPQLGKHRYVTFVGGRRFKKVARQALRYKVFPYPKGDTRRHELVRE
jgi:hypothetical protein